MIRVPIAADSLFIRTMLRDLLKDSPDITIVGTAANGIDALEKIDDEIRERETFDHCNRCRRCRHV